MTVAEGAYARWWWEWTLWQVSSTEPPLNNSPNLFAATPVALQHNTVDNSSRHEERRARFPKHAPDNGSGYLRKTKKGDR